MLNGDRSTTSQETFRPTHPDVPSMGHAVLVFMLGLAVLYFSRDFGPFTSKVIHLLIYVLAPLWVCYMFQFDVRRTFFIRFPGWRSWLGIIIGSVSMFAVLTSLQSLLWTVPSLQPSPDVLRQHYYKLWEMFGADIWSLVLIIGIFIPICEELLFRGFFLRAIRESSNSFVAILVIGLFFGLLHPPRISQILISVFGIYLGCVLWFSKSVISSIMIHMLYNCFVLASWDLMFQEPESILALIPPPYRTAAAVAVVLLLIGSLYLFYTDEPAETDEQKQDQPGNELYPLFS